MISTVTYNGDGATRIFPVAFEIKGEEYTVVYVGGVAVADRSLYDIINNAIVFNIAPVIGTNNVEIVVASTTTEIADLNAPPSTIQTVLDNMVDINAIANTVIPNIDEILLADDNATTATTKALEALTSANNADTSEANALTYSNNALTSANNADASEAQALSYKNSAEASATTATTQAGIATTKSGEASASAGQALTSRNEAEGFRNEAEASALSVDSANIVHKTGDETIAGVKTFSSSPILPVPTLANQAISMGNIIEKTGVGLGYGTGSGGTVTQLTSKVTPVTINKVCGQITMNNESLAAGATVNMLVNNSMSFGTNGDIVVVSGRTGDASAGSYTYTVSNSSNGSFYIAVRNITAAARAESLIINFAIIKGATS